MSRQIQQTEFNGMSDKKDVYSNRQRNKYNNRKVKGFAK